MSLSVGKLNLIILPVADCVYAASFVKVLDISLIFDQKPAVDKTPDLAIAILLN